KAFKLEEDYGLEGVSGDDLIGEEIKCLDLQFHYKGKWLSLDNTEVIDFQICKNPSTRMVMDARNKISFGFSLENCTRYAKIEINGMSIPLIGDNSNKASPIKNNLSSHKVHLSAKDITSDSHICRISSHQKKKRYGEAKIIKSVIVSESDSTTSSGSE
ncbi:4475_t:CDS:1, partial [Paraglomus brasilianum]